MWSIVISTIVYFAASFFIKRWLDGMDIPKTMMRTILVFVLAIFIAYGSAAVISWLFPGA